MFTKNRSSATPKDITLTKRDPTERRKSRRFPVEGPAFVEFSLDAPGTGQIVDISKGGVSFRYMSKGKQPSKTFELRIYSSRDDFSTEKIPVKTVYDLTMPAAFSITKTTMRRRGARFATLTPSQRSQLEYFIENYGREEDSTH